MTFIISWTCEVMAKTHDFILQRNLRWCEPNSGFSSLAQRTRRIPVKCGATQSIWLPSSGVRTWRPILYRRADLRTGAMQPLVAAPPPEHSQNGNVCSGVSGSRGGLRSCTHSVLLRSLHHLSVCIRRFVLPCPLANILSVELTPAQ